jgi:type II secretory pathway pseudopilin PulG
MGPDRHTPAAGWSLVELVLALGVSLVVAGLAAAAFAPWRDDVRALGAARHLAMTLQQVRLEAVAAGRSCGLQFVPSPGGLAFRRVIDGNGNGLRSLEIDDGVDLVRGPARRPGDDFAGVRFAIVHDLPPLEGGPPLPDGADPIRLGGSLLAFAPTGSATSGTLYLASAERRQFAVRVLGATGRVRLFELDRGTSRWRRR